MATTTTQISQSSNNEINRQEIQAAIAKAVELRALHAALMQGNSPANPRFLSSSPVSRLPSQFSAHDYPVFTPVSLLLYFLFTKSIILSVILTTVLFYFLPC